VKESAGWIFNPQGIGDLSSSIGFFICIVLGLLFYIYYMYRNTTRGIDVRTIYMNIPPE
jgi:hypothetical protein